MTYVPWDKVKPEELEGFCEGGMLDSDTLNPGNAVLVYVKSRRAVRATGASFHDEAFF